MGKVAEPAHDAKGSASFIRVGGTQQVPGATPRTGLREIRITCTTADRELHAGVLVRAQFRGSPSSVDRDSGFAENTQDTGGEGVAKFAMPAELADLTSFVAGVDSDQWFSPQRVTIHDLEVNNYTGVASATLRIVPVVKMYVDASYADGAAYDGEVKFIQEGTQRAVLVRHGRGELGALPVAETIVSAIPQRAGYSAFFRKVEAAEVATGRMSVLIETSRWPRAGLVITAPDPGPIEQAAFSTYLTIVNAGKGSRVNQGRMPYTKERGLYWAKYEMMPGSYTITARMNDQVAYATALLVPNEITEIELIWGGGAELRATVIGADGQPIRGAVLYDSAGPYPIFPVRAARAGTRAITNDEGVATLRGIAPGEQTFVVEAPGYEVFEIQLALLEYTTTDVLCALKLATGKITVSLVNAIEGGEYLVSYGRPGMLGDPQDLAIVGGKTLVIPNMPIREYCVWARGSENGPVSQHIFNLATAGGDGEVVLDVWNLKPR